MVQTPNLGVTLCSFGHFSDVALFFWAVQRFARHNSRGAEGGGCLKEGGYKIHAAGELQNIPPLPPKKWGGEHISGSQKMGVELKGGSLHDGFGGFDGFGGSREHLALRLLVLQNTGTMTQPWRF